MSTSAGGAAAASGPWSSRRSPARTCGPTTRCLYSRDGTAYAWEQEIEGSPFAKVLKSSVTRFELSPADDGTRVAVEQEQRMRGMSRLGGFMLRRATGDQLNEALDGLEHALTADPQAEEPDEQPA